MTGNHIKRLISEGEHQRLDFKFEISDFRKIARSLCAFANTDGGRLLVGVKDNGTIAGVRSEEEYYMVEGAARLYCRPEVKFETHEWDVDGRKVLEVIVGKDRWTEPHKAQDREGRWKVYIRAGDQNLLANVVLLRLWERQREGKGVFMRFTRVEKLLLELLERDGEITMQQFRKLAGISYHKTVDLLVDFLMIGIIEMRITEKETYYFLSADYQEQLAPWL